MIISKVIKGSKSLEYGEHVGIELYWVAGVDLSLDGEMEAPSR